MLTIKKKSVKAGKLVNTEHVNTLIRTYKQERWGHNSKRLGKEDSLSVWYSLAELEEFLVKAKDHGSDGIRVYFGVYDKDYTSELHAGRQTVVFVATREKETANGSVNKDVYINDEKGTTILAYNIGNPCPPFCNTGDGGPGIGITIVEKSDGELVIT